MKFSVGNFACTKQLVKQKMAFSLSRACLIFHNNDFPILKFYNCKIKVESLKKTFMVIVIYEWPDKTQCFKNIWSFSKSGYLKIHSKSG